MLHSSGQAFYFSCCLLQILVKGSHSVLVCKATLILLQKTRSLLETPVKLLPRLEQFSEDCLEEFHLVALVSRHAFVANIHIAVLNVEVDVLFGVLRADFV